MFIKKEADGIKFIETYQGVWMRIVALITQHGATYIIKDDRDRFPDPVWRNMFGFRFKQQELLEEFLTYRCSGIMAAVTRYGKTIMMINIIRAFPGLYTVVLVPGIDLLDQLAADFKAALPQRTVTQIGGSSKKQNPGEDITLCSMDSMHLLDHTRIRLVLVDEVHELATDTRVPEFVKITRARKFGFSGSAFGRFDGRDVVTEGIVGPVLVDKTYRQARAEGAVCALKIFFLRVPLYPQEFRDRNIAYRRLLWMNTERLADVRYISDRILPVDAQTILFIANEKQGNAVYDALGGERRLAMAKVLTAAERRELTADMRANDIKRCISSEIFSTGVTFSDLSAVINIGGGGGSVSCVQKPGRLLEIRPGKKCGVMFEFLFHAPMPGPGEKSEEWGAWRSLVSDSDARHMVYQSKGYELFYADTLAELEQLYKRECL